MKKLLSEFLAVEERLDQMELNIAKNIEDKMLTVHQQASRGNTIPMAEDINRASKTYNEGRPQSEPLPPYDASDYDAALTHSDYVSQLSRELMFPLCKSSVLLGGDELRSAINAIRSDLAEWRKTQCQLSLRSASAGRTLASSGGLTTPLAQGKL